MSSKSENVVRRQHQRQRHVTWLSETDIFTGRDGGDSGLLYFKDEASDSAIAVSSRGEYGRSRDTSSLDTDAKYLTKKEDSQMMSLAKLFDSVVGSKDDNKMATKGSTVSNTSVPRQVEEKQLHHRRMSSLGVESKNSRESSARSWASWQQKSETQEKVIQRLARRVLDLTDRLKKQSSRYEARIQQLERENATPMAMADSAKMKQLEGELKKSMEHNESLTQSNADLIAANEKATNQLKELAANEPMPSDEQMSELKREGMCKHAEEDHLSLTKCVEELTDTTDGIKNKLFLETLWISGRYYTSQ